MSTVGLNEATIRKYIQEQEKADMIKDKLSAKEYEDPFKGERLSSRRHPFYGWRRLNKKKLPGQRPESQIC